MENQLKSILLKNDFHKKIGLNERALESFIDSVFLDIHYSHFNVRKLPLLRSHLLIKVFVVFAGVIVSNIYYLFRIRNSNKKNISKIKYIFLPFSDINYIRFKHIPYIFQDEFLIIYPPAFHIQGIIKHLNYFRSKDISVLTPNFGLRTAIIFLYKAIRINKQIRKISREIREEISDHASYRFQGGSLIFLLNSIFYKYYLDTLDIEKNQRLLWFFDFDKDYKYIAINSLLKKSRPNDFTIHLHHGVFWGNNISYIRPNSDFVFCCSERERRIISTSINQPDRIFVNGAPLQSFDTHFDDCKKIPDIKVDILILLADSGSSNYELQSGILNFFKNSEYDYAIRMRPSSIEMDLVNFSKYLDMKKISYNNSLSDDIERARVVISFSEDALFECFKKERPIFFGSAANLNFINLSVLDTLPFFIFNSIEEFKNCFYIDKLDLKYHSKEFIISNFGETNFEVVKKMFLRNCCEIFKL